jgi:AcrR family transcriptional regulator
MEIPRAGRERLVAIAVDLFYRHGYNAVGIDRVISTAGVTKTTFYKHFQSKDDLIESAVRRRDEWESAAWAAAIQKIAGDDLIRYPIALLDVLDLWFNHPDYHGCMFLNTAIEYPNPHDPIHQAAAAYKHKMRDGWRDFAREVGASARDAEIFADCLCALIEGALSLRHTHDRNDAARAIRPAVKQLIATYLPAKPPATTRRKPRRHS